MRYNSTFTIFIPAFVFFCLSITLVAQENTAILCSDGIDNDNDGFTDCNDSQCIALANGGCLTCFNDGLSFADYVIEYSQTCGNMNSFIIPEEALGVANDTIIIGVPRKYVSLGEGGFIKLGFSDNLLINSGDPDPDVWVFESGSAVESSEIELRPADPITMTSLSIAGILDVDGDGFFEFGSIMGSTSSIDIDEFVPGILTGILKFNAIKITDIVNANCDGGSPGADIDAVCALSSVSSEVCDNGIDDDLDGFIDCDDPQLMNECCCLVTNTIELGEDIATCFGDTIMLEVPAVFNSYAWSTGSIQPQIVVTVSGIYSVTVGEVNNCDLVDEINIIIGADPVIQRTVFKCPGDEITVDGRTFQSPGMYFDTIFNLTGVCDTFFEFEIIDYNLNEQFLGEDQIVCSREHTIFSPFNTTNWPDGTIGNQFTATTSGDFVITAIDTAGCLLTDSISIDLINLGQFYIPNAFSPNNDGINELFGPLFPGNNNLEYTLNIYDRWGGKLFSETGASVAWDGTASEKKVNPGTYLYQLTYNNELCGVAEEFSGSLLLVR